MGEKESPVCEEHKTKMEYLDCSRCDGQGYTMDDIDDYLNPVVWGNGNCFECEGTGISPYPSCYMCDDEFQEELYG